MLDNLTKSLSIGVVDDEELASVIGSLFPRGSGNTESVEYQNEHEECAITLTYKNGVIVHAAQGPALTKEKLDEIVGKIRSTILAEGSKKIARSFLFSYDRSEGFWRYKDQFQILPAPAAAPDPTEGYAQHPLLLEVNYVGASDRHVEQVRLSRKHYEIRLLLHLFLNGNIVWRNTQAQKSWVIVGDGLDAHSEWRQLDYIVPNFQPVAESFSDTKDFRDLSTVAVDEYFSRLGISMNNLEIPANLEALFDAFYVLSHDERVQFLRACFWYYTAGSAGSVTPALQYNCLVTAVETLLGDTEKVPCKCCGKDTSPGPTGKFKSFLETYAPGEHNNKDRGAFYTLRSNLSHGSMLFRHDLPRAFSILHPTEIGEWESGGRINRLARIGLMNWMLSHAKKQNLVA